MNYLGQGAPGQGGACFHPAQGHEILNFDRCTWWKTLLRYFVRHLAHGTKRPPVVLSPVFSSNQHTSRHSGRGGLNGSLVRGLIRVARSFCSVVIQFFQVYQTSLCVLTLFSMLDQKGSGFGSSVKCYQGMYRPAECMRALRVPNILWVAPHTCRRQSVKSPCMCMERVPSSLFIGGTRGKGGGGVTSRSVAISFVGFSRSSVLGSVLLSLLASFSSIFSVCSRSDGGPTAADMKTSEYSIRVGYT